MVVWGVLVVAPLAFVGLEGAQLRAGFPQAPIGLAARSLFVEGGRSHLFS